MNNRPEGNQENQSKEQYIQSLKQLYEGMKVAGVRSDKYKELDRESVLVRQQLAEVIGETEAARTVLDMREEILNEKID